MQSTQNKIPAYARREFNRANGLFVVTLLGSVLLLLWGMWVMGGSGIAYYSPTRFGVPWSAHDLWQFIRAAALIAIGFGVAVAGVDGIERYHEVKFLHLTNGELSKEISDLKWGTTTK